MPAAMTQREDKLNELKADCTKFKWYLRSKQWALKRRQSRGITSGLLTSDSVLRM